MKKCIIFFVITMLKPRIALASQPSAQPSSRVQLSSSTAPINAMHRDGSTQESVSPLQSQTEKKCCTSFLTGFIKCLIACKCMVIPESPRAAIRERSGIDR